MPYYKVNYFINADESGRVQVVVTNEEGLNGLQNDRGIEVFDYQEVNIEEEMK